MPSSQQDYLLRMLQQVAAAIARMLRRKSAGDFVGARQELNAAIGQLLGPSAQLAPMMDSRTASGLVSDARIVTSWALLLRQDAELMRLLSMDAAAAATDRRALELLLESWLRAKELNPEMREALGVLLARVDVTSLMPRYRDAIATLPPLETPEA